MKVNFNVELMDMDDKPIVAKAGAREIIQAMLEAGLSQEAVAELMDPISKRLADAEAESKSLTAKEAARQALGSPDDKASGAERVDRMDLAIRITKADGEIEITKTEKEMLLGRVRAWYHSPLPYYRMNQLLAEKA